MSIKDIRARNEAITSLKELIKPGDTVYTVLRHKSASGMRRFLDVFVIKYGEPLRITCGVGIAADYSYNRKHEALTVDGCGMDVGFGLVYKLSATMWPGGDGSYKTGRNGMSGPETDGGYLLKHRWL